MNYDPKKIIGYFLIGASSDDVSKRRINWKIDKIGWKGFVEKWITPAIDLGITRFHLHNPGGTLPNEPMQADQFIQASDANLPWILDGFAEAFYPITSKGNEVIAYLGSLEQTTFFKIAKGSHEAAFADKYLDRLNRSYALPLQADCSIGFDAIFDISPNSPEYHFIRLLQSLKIKTYIEPWPYKGAPHLWDCNFICTYDNYLNKLQDSSWPAEQKDLRGEGCIILNTPPDQENWATYRKWGPKLIREFHAMNLSTMVSITELVNGKIPLKEWMGPDPIKKISGITAVKHKI